MGLVELPQPVRLAVEWESGRVDFIPIERHRGLQDADLDELRQLTRDLSQCSASVKRSWLEDREGRLLYSAIDGRGQPRKELPMA